jgi:uncharacterized protein (DUF1778 family)
MAIIERGLMMTRTGRPPIDNPRNKHLQVRLLPEEKERIKEVAKALNVTETELIISAVNEYAKKHRV